MLQLSSPVFVLSARNAWHYDPPSAYSAFPEAPVTSKLLLRNQSYSKIRAVRSRVLLLFGLLWWQSNGATENFDRMSDNCTCSQEPAVKVFLIK